MFIRNGFTNLQNLKKCNVLTVVVVVEFAAIHHQQQQQQQLQQQQQQQQRSSTLHPRSRQDKINRIWFCKVPEIKRRCVCTYVRTYLCVRPFLLQT